MTRKVSIITYHYVRELENSRFPKIKGLSITLFKEQIRYILKHYNVIKMETLIESINIKKELPRNPLILTFDDGYIDHFTNVFPILQDFDIQGTFFPPAKAIIESEVLDVNKIHFILASVQNKTHLVNEIFSLLNEFRKNYALESNSYYYEMLAKPNRYDDPQIVFIKRILQRELPEELRHTIIDNLFKKYLKINEKIFSRELYMNIDQLKCMKKNGMFIGCHGYNHFWLNTLNRKNQEQEIDLSLEFLRSIGCNTNDWVMCYPYGAYNDSLLSILKNKRCILGFTVEVGIADLDENNLLILPRLDTNDLPKDNIAKFTNSINY